MTKRILLAGLLLGLWSHAEAAVVCVQKSGVMRVREACKKNETPLDPATVGLKPASVAVYDVNDKKVGDVVDAAYLDWPVVLFHMQEHWFAVQVLKDLFFTNRELFFESPDCTGQAFIEVSVSGQSSYFALQFHLLSAVAVAPPGFTVYTPDLNAVVRFASLRSHLPIWDQCSIAELYTEVLPVFPLVDLSTMFTPPFTLR